MDEYPNSDEEFELMHSEDLELLREQDNFYNDSAVKKAKKVLDFNSGSQLSQNGINSNETLSSSSQPQSQLELQPESQSQSLSSFSNLSTENQSTTTARKRTIEEIFGEIDDILNEEANDRTKRRKSNDYSDSDLIERILDARRQAKELLQPKHTINKENIISNEDHAKYNFSTTIPKYSHLSITNHEGQKVYVRFHSEQYEMDETQKLIKSLSFSGCMGEAFKNIWNEANEEVNKKLDALESLDVVELENNEVSNNTAQLWVDLYKPHKYLELLSDEGTNRTLLKWLKLWDKLVFNKSSKVRDFVKPFFQRNDLNTTLDDYGRPQQKVVLLCGPPGLGKTTLAHMVAQHAGYNPIEVNASDDRSVENFKTILENSTQMQSVIDRSNRPNCLIFDEIDGASSASIEFLVKFINETVVAKKKKNQSKQTSNVLKRPIICICNDVYVPSLRSLRQIAFVLNFPPTSSIRLADRLQEIARHQNINSDYGALLALAEKSGNDIRTCLSVLHFFKSSRKPLTLTQINKKDVGDKDKQKSLFAVWNDIFQIKFCETTRKIKNPKERMEKILNVVRSFGDYERLLQGVFENYPELKMRDASLEGTCECLEWFSYTDQLQTKIYSLQNYELWSYIPYAFVVAHFAFANTGFQKLHYPSSAYEVRTKTAKNAAILTEVLKGMRPAIRAHSYKSSLLLDVLPLLMTIIVPNFRPVNLHVFSAQEKENLTNIAASMLDYNLNYVQERDAEGSYVYKIDPDVEDLVTFPNAKPKKTVTYSSKQLIAQEIEVQKMRSIQSSIKIGGDESQKKNHVPNHLQKLKPKLVKSKVMTSKDFFGRTIQKKSDTARTDSHFGGDVWYRFKEGYSNAVRRGIKMRDLK